MRPGLDQDGYRRLRNDQDILNEFITEGCDTDSCFAVAKESLYMAYEVWCTTNGHRPMAQKRLTRQLGERKFPLSPCRRKIEGLTLKRGTSTTHAHDFGKARDCAI